MSSLVSHLNKKYVELVTFTFFYRAVGNEESSNLQFSFESF